MGLFVRTGALGLAAALASCAGAVKPPAEQPFNAVAIVDQAASGKIDICGDARWATWRFGGREDNIAALQAEVQKRQPRSSWMMSEPEQRVSRLGNELDAVVAAPDRDTLDQAQARASQARADGLATEAAITGSDFKAARARLAVWTDATKTSGDDGVYLSALQCAIRPESSRTVAAVGSAFVETVFAGGRPSDSRDGAGSERLIFTRMTRNWFREADGRAACQRLRDSVFAGTADIGPAVSLLEGLGCNGVETNAADFVAHREAEWAPLRAYLLGLPAATIAEELASRTTLEQIGIRNASRYNTDFAADQRTRPLQNRILSLTESASVENTERVKQLLVGRAWFDDKIDGVGAQSAGFLIVQYADHDPDFQRAMLSRWEKMLDTGRVSKPDYAVLWDRLAVHDRKPQRYGTQLTCDHSGPGAGEIEDPADLDKRRAALELGPWAAYRDGWVAENSCYGATRLRP